MSGYLNEGLFADYSGGSGSADFVRNAVTPGLLSLSFSRGQRLPSLIETATGTGLLWSMFSAVSGGLVRITLYFMANRLLNWMLWYNKNFTLSFFFAFPPPPSRHIFRSRSAIMCPWVLIKCVFRVLRFVLNCWKIDFCVSLAQWNTKPFHVAPPPTAANLSSIIYICSLLNAPHCILIGDGLNSETATLYWSIKYQLNKLSLIDD